MEADTACYERAPPSGESTAITDYEKEHPQIINSMCFWGKRVHVKAHVHFRIPGWAQKMRGTDEPLRKHCFYCQKSVEIQLKAQLWVK